MAQNLFKRASSKLELMTDLEKLKEQLVKLGPIPSGKAVYDYGVKFFNIIANFQDAHALDKKTLESFKTPEMVDVAKHIQNAGRQEYGWVRAQRGEPVTLHNLYLGNVYGIWTKTAAFFKEYKESDVQTIIQNQLSSFIKSHREPMIELLNKISLNEKKPNKVLAALGKGKQK